jgi:asparagine synthase (glutamine-hydrolysing)
MCGLAGAIVAVGGRISHQRLEAMTNVIAHRGPDGKGIWISTDGRVGLGHRRLSVIDLSPAGAQPMTSASGRFTVSFNGEIYNFGALRQELESVGVRFHSHSDTEVMLAAFDAWGVSATLTRLAGMFAFAVWDATENALWIARDRLGIKPLYYSTIDSELTFASELRALVIWQGKLPPVSAQGLTEYLRLGYVPGPASIFDGIQKLPPGCFAVYRAGQLSEPQAYWKMADVVRAGMAQPLTDTTQALDTLEEHLHAAVAGQMVSDVPLGAFLSGGIDSSAVVALMQAQSGRPVKTFSIGFHERGHDEAQHAAAVARHLGTEHTELYVTDTDARAVIPQLPDIYDEPFADPSQIPTFLVSKLAREHVTVALSGDGGDELFAGYNRYVFVARFWQRLQLLPSPLRRLAARALSSPSPAAWDAFYERAAPLLPRHLIPALPGQKMHKIASILPSPSLLALHARLVAQWANPKTVLNPRWYHDGLLWQDQLGQDDALSAPEQQMVWDTQTYLVDDILTKVDRASMRVGLEARVPLLDHSVLEFAWRIPMSMKIKDGTGKWLLKQMLYRHVPQALVDRPKMGFSVPIDAWLRGSLREWAQTYLAEDRIIAEGFFDARVVRQTWEQHLKGAIDAGGPLWTLLMFQLWLEKVKQWV